MGTLHMSNSRIQTDRLCSLCGLEFATVYPAQPHCYWCEKCRKIKNQEKHKRIMAIRPDAERERKRLWAKDHREKTVEYNRRWRHSNPGKTAEFSRKYRQRRFFQFASHVLKGLTGVRIPAITLWGMWKKQHGRCALTGRKLDGHTRYNASLDHAVAHSKGGSTEPSNLRWVCLEANLAKHKLSDEEFVQLCADVVRHKRNGTRSKVAYI